MGGSTSEVGNSDVQEVEKGGGKSEEMVGIGDGP